MSERPTGIDQSWGYAEPAAVAAAGVRVVSMYLSRDPSKNATATKVKAYHARGVGVLLNWESDSGAPLRGAGQGRADAEDAVTQVRALIRDVGYAPGSRLAVVFSCDRDVNASQWAAIDAYYGATLQVTAGAGFVNGAYGEADLIDHLHAQGLTAVEWQSSAWSNGRVSPVADLLQYLNGQTLGGASVDFDRVIHEADLGVWWPPGSALDTSTTEDELQDADIEKIAAAVWAHRLHAGKTDMQAGSWLVSAQRQAGAAASAAKAAGDGLAAMLPRVASLQAAVSKLTPGSVDAAAVAAAVVAKVKALSWGAK